VVAAAVILPADHGIDGVTDSKALSATRRVQLADRIVASATAWCVASATRSEIDELNILNATHLAMQRAVEGLATAPSLVRVDGNRRPEFAWNRVPLSAECLIGGDALDVAIGAASILAKVWRDQHMLNLDAQYPQYGFARHKGYPTAAHMAALRAHGPCPEHRRSYKPVRKAMDARR
ncbi:MAG: ribonuclease HII, partial [Pseudomonadota bacterium]